MHHVLQYLYIYQLLCTALCFFTQILILASTLFDVFDTIFREMYLNWVTEDGVKNTETRSSKN
jgi:hypothetical protein